MPINKKLLAICILIPLAVGGVSALLTSSAMQSFEALNQPPLSPPGWLFPIVWTILFLLMGIASYLVATADAPQPVRHSALRVYAIQLAFNFLWTIVFFNLRWYLFAIVWLLALWGLILLCGVRFCRIRRAAGYLLLPYLLWCTFAAYLNMGIYLLNR